MFNFYTPNEAKSTILKRNSIDDYEIPNELQKNIFKLFGENLTPDQVVRKILKDVRENGDTSLQKWTLTLDGISQSTFRISNEEIKSSMDMI
ncbi:MAG TPA: histidinol dehydrogenase, partial [Anaerolineaceae bacterium]|nr:histidinol dehydrogenase [Anaerolineaceae bacterium]